MNTYNLLNIWNENEILNLEEWEEFQRINNEITILNKKVLKRIGGVE